MEALNLDERRERELRERYEDLVLVVAGAYDGAAREVEMLVQCGQWEELKAFSLRMFRGMNRPRAHEVGLAWSGLWWYASLHACELENRRFNHRMFCLLCSEAKREKHKRATRVSRPVAS